MAVWFGGAVKFSHSFMAAEEETTKKTKHLDNTFLLGLSCDRQNGRIGLTVHSPYLRIPFESNSEN